MAETVRLTVQTGPHRGRRFCFRGPASCLVGRGEDCFMRFIGTERDLKISRHHCQLDIDPPQVNVEDLGSLNGTYINGRQVRPIEPGHDLPADVVRSGDTITIGGTSFSVDVVDCPPHLPNLEEFDPVWQEGEMAKVDCPIPCSRDGFMPCLGCCAGGVGVPRASAAEP